MLQLLCEAHTSRKQKAKIQKLWREWHCNIQHNNGFNHSENTVQEYYKQDMLWQVQFQTLSPGWKESGAQLNLPSDKFCKCHEGILLVLKIVSHVLVSDLLHAEFGEYVVNHIAAFHLQEQHHMRMSLQTDRQLGAQQHLHIRLIKTDAHRPSIRLMKKSKTTLDTAIKCAIKVVKASGSIKIVASVINRLNILCKKPNTFYNN